MVEALQSLGKVVECHIYPGEGHSFAGKEAIEDSIVRIDHFLATYLL